MNRAVEFIVRPYIEAACRECGHKVQPRSDGMFEISPHLRERHGFNDGPIKFTQVSEVICPPMRFIEAAQ